MRQVVAESPAIATLDFSGHVLDHLQSLAGAIRQRASAWVEQPTDKNALEQLAAACVECRDVSRLIGSHGVSRLCSEWLELLGGILAQQLDTRMDVAPVALTAAARLEEYIAWLRTGRKDIPLALLPVLNNLRACRHAPLLTEALVVSPEFDFASPDKPPFEQIETQRQVLGDARLVFVPALLEWLRQRAGTASSGGQEQAALQRLSGICAELADSMQAGWGDLMLAVGALVEGLDEHRRQLAGQAAAADFDDALATLLLGQAERLLAQLERADTVDDVDFPGPLFRNLLYFLVRFDLRNPAAGRLRSRFRLQELLPSPARLKAARNALGIVSAGADQTLGSALINELEDIKGQLDTMSIQGRPDTVQLHTIVVRLEQLSCTALMTGLHDARHWVDQAGETLQAETLTDTEYAEAAHALVRFEIAVQQWLRGEAPASRSDGNTRREKSVRAGANGAARSDNSLAYYDQTVTALHVESVSAMQRVQRLLDNTLDSAATDWQHNATLNEAVRILQTTADALQILPLPEIRPLLVGLASYLKALQGLGRGAVADELEHLALVLVCAEYYLDRLLYRQPAASELLAQADISIQALTDSVRQFSPETASLPSPGSGDEPGRERILVRTIVDGLPLVHRQILGLDTDAPGQGRTELAGWMTELSKQAKAAGIEPVISFADQLAALAGATDNHDRQPTADELQLLEEGAALLPRIAQHIGSQEPGRLQSLEAFLDKLSSRRASVMTGQRQTGADTDRRRGDPAGQGRATADDTTDAQDTATTHDVTERIGGIKVHESTSQIVSESADPLIDFDETVALSGSIEKAADEHDHTLLQVFFRECDTHLDFLLAQLDTALAGHDILLPDAETQRALHTVNGSARTAAVPEVVALVQPMDTLVSDRLSTHGRLSLAEISVMRDALGLLSALLLALAKGQPAPDELPEVRAGLQALLQQNTLASESHESLRQSESAGGDPVDQPLARQFLQEAGELLESLRETASVLPDHRAQASAIKSALADLHTLKGSAGIARFRPVADIASALEDALGRWAVPLHTRQLELTQDALDALTLNLEQAGTGRSMGQFDWLTQQLYSREENLDLTPAINPALHPADSIAAKNRPTAELADVADDTAADRPGSPDIALDEVAAEDTLADDTTLVEPGHPVVSRQLPVDQPAEPAPAELDPDQLEKLTRLATDACIEHAQVDGRLEEMQQTMEQLSATTERLGAKLDELPVGTLATLAVGEDDATARFDAADLAESQLQQQTRRQLREILADIRLIQTRFSQTLYASRDNLVTSRKLGEALQQSLSRSRLIPFSQMQPWLQSLCRHTAHQSGLKVALTITGTAHQVDRRVMQMLRGPLEHILRNAIVHGIEPPADRAGAGKSETGQIDLDVSVNGSHLVIEVRDDGRGVDLARVAADFGLPPENTAALVQKLFASGYTTLDQPSDLAGRGLGLDAARRAVDKLRGSLHLSTESDRGTQVVMRIPQPSMVSQVVLLRTGGGCFGIPAEAVEAVIDLPTGSSGATEAAMQGTVEYRLDEQLGLPTGESLCDQAIILSLSEKKVLLRVEALVGYRELVAQPLGPQLDNLKHYSGGGVLPDGTSVLLLDPHRLPMAETLSEEPVLSTGARQPDSGEPGRAPVVLVVDDSITMRTNASRILIPAGYRVELAENGSEALVRLAELKPALILLDLEMPGLDGFEMLSQARRDKLISAPVVVISALGGVEVRDRASSLGVEHYLLKPYTDEDLLRLVMAYLPTDA